MPNSLNHVFSTKVNEHACNTDNAQCTMLMPKTPTKIYSKLQSVHRFKCTQRKQSSSNPYVFVHHALKESNELCAMLMPSNEHVRNANAKFTHITQQQCKVFHQKNLQNYKVCTLPFK